MKPITTLEGAKALPEKSPFIMKHRKQTDGSILNIPSFRKLAAVEEDDKAILFFQDSDGRMMGIGYCKEGAYKVAVYLMRNE